MFAERALLLVAATAFAFAALPLIPSVPVRRVMAGLAPLVFLAGLLKPVVADAAMPPPQERMLELHLPVLEQSAPGVEPEPLVQEPVTYQVVPGDSLWAIACRDLGGDASDAAVNRRWRQIYAANRAPIGDNPDLIYPGQALSMPEVNDG